METTQSPVQLCIIDDIAYLSINRPEKHNAFDDEVISLLINALEHVKLDTDVRALCLSAAGTTFSAGADLGWMKRMAQLSYDENVEDARHLARLMSTLDNLPVPTIAKVQGAAFGGAIGLIACCDIAIASQTASFCLSEVKLGLSPATISPYVINAMGARRCRQLFLTAERFDAGQAEAWGLVHRTVSHEELDDAVTSTLSLIKHTGPKASQATKQLIKDVSLGELDTTEYTAKLIAELRVSEEGQAGLGAFFDKQPPPWNA